VTDHVTDHVHVTIESMTIESMTHVIDHVYVTIETITIESITIESMTHDL